METILEQKEQKDDLSVPADAFEICLQVSVVELLRSQRLVERLRDVAGCLVSECRPSERVLSSPLSTQTATSALPEAKHFTEINLKL